MKFLPVNRTISPIIAFLLFAIVSSIVSGTAHADVVRPSFKNELQIPPGVNPPSDESSSAAFFGGHIVTEGTADVPGTADRTYCLPASSFGQSFANNVPYSTLVEDAINQALVLLYQYDSSTQDQNSRAAFRYLNMLYSRGDGEDYIYAQFEDISDWWGDTERERALEAAEILKDVMRYEPINRELRWQLLDIYYNIVVADLALARDVMIDAIQASLGLRENNEFIDMPYGEFTISHEIAYLEAAIGLYEKASNGYYDLFNNSLGFDVTDIDPEAPEGIPFGHYIFSKEVPLRSLESPLKLDLENGGILVSPEEIVPGNPYRYDPYVVLNGYKDLVLLFDLQKEYVRCSSELIRKYILRNAAVTEEEPSDKDKALSLIAHVQEKSYLEGNVLLGICPDYEDAGINSGLMESIGGWQHEISQIGSLRGYIDGDLNLLGFTDDFLALVQSVIPGDQEAAYFHSFDFFKEYIAGPQGGLTVAEADLFRARNDFGNYRDRQDQLATQFYEKTEMYNDRLFKIMGARPGEEAYLTPFDNVGCELYQQKINIQLAEGRIERCLSEITTIEKEVKVEVERRGKEAEINNAMNIVYIRYGEKQTKLTKEISYVNAVQAYHNALSQGSGWVDVLTAQIVISSYNATVQAGSEVIKGTLQAKKEKLAAMQSAEIGSLNDQLLDVNSKARIKTLMLRMSILSLDVEEAMLARTLELGRLESLINEKADLERRKEESNAQLAERYFADPSHRLIKDESILRTEFSFEKAQRWLYYMVKALEYKWNQKFEHEDHGRTYNANTLLALRNSDELRDMYQAMVDWDSLVSISSRNDDDYKKFSICEDFLGYRYGTQYPDPVTGESVEAWQAFRSYLSREDLYLSPDDANNPIPGYKVLKLEFSTAYEPESGGLFMKNRWLEKIKYMRVKAYGGAVGGKDSIKPGYLKYSGNSYIRNKKPGTMVGDRPDRITDEMTSYSTHYWWWDTEHGWQMNDGLGSAISIQVSNDPDLPASVPQIDVFKEYSVATSNWILYVPVESSGGLPLLDITRLTDIEIHFYFYWYARNNY